jgi:hypothetical protein
MGYKYNLSEYVKFIDSIGNIQTGYIMDRDNVGATEDRYRYFLIDEYGNMITVRDSDIVGYNTSSIRDNVNKLLDHFNNQEDDKG